MFVPFISSRGKSALFRRKGGGGHGGGEGGGGESGGGSSSSSNHSSGEGGEGEGESEEPVSVSGTSKSSSSTSNGGGKAVTIPSGQPFAGRSAGGGTRSDIYGSSSYGSGYPGYTGRGVYGRPFPFYYWPIVWGEQNNYLDDQDEYGSPSNTSRPGGPMVEATYVSSSSNTTFHILSDNSTIISLIASINGSSCSFNQAPSSNPSQLPSTYNASDPTQPQATSAIQYYRASSIALTLDGYNNTGALSNDSSTPDTPLPSGIDTSLLSCLNATIGATAPLISGSGQGFAPPPQLGLLGLVWIFWSCVGYLL